MAKKSTKAAATETPPPSDGDKKSQQPRATWKFKAKSALIDFLIEVKVGGKASKNGFKNSVWEEAACVLNASGYGPYNAKQCQTQWNSGVKAGYTNLKFLKEKSGVSWDDKKKMITMGDDWWEPYMAIEKYKKFKNTPFLLWDNCTFLVNGIQATGMFSISNGLLGTKRDEDQDGEEDSDDGRDGAESETDENSQSSQDTSRASIPIDPILLTESATQQQSLSQAPPSATTLVISSALTNTTTTPAKQRSTPSDSSRKRKHSGRISTAEAIAGLGSQLGSLVRVMREDDTKDADRSPVRKKRAWTHFEEEDAGELSNQSYSASVKVFSKTELCDEYLRFPANRKSAWKLWVRDEVDKIRANQ
ncbi:hypothetical protein JAAARDRAFT_703302 [Jaapia argillacea MUCL 33604]|uniref:Myb/SANT-like domain-containing protein n=1 Tax=Jaapia argillacea MUCL 33604 TaxID=933084 RepID=A0A067PEA2_9AGAM|nr:hypothetical protein JAAARDRAFT_703302 [Jaapia argillacea MUCL 33604]